MMKKIRNSRISISLIIYITGLLTTGCCKKEIPVIEIPIVTTDKIFNITDNTAVCKGKIISDGGSQKIKCGVCWATDSALLSIEKAPYTESLQDTFSFTGSIIKLTPNTTYFGKAYASNETGTGYGKAIKFTTVSPYTNNINFNTSSNYGNLVDQDGNSYKTIKIGAQVWMAENLKAISFSNGVSLIYASDYCWYNNDIVSNRATYGALYSTWVVQKSNLCPAGWHVPSKNDWNTLALTLDPNTQIDRDPIICNGGGKLKETGTTHWRDPNAGATNTSGFTALPGGYGNHLLVTVDSLGFNGYFWSSTWIIVPPRGQTPGLSLHYCAKINFNREALYINYNGPVYSSVRCIKDSE
jgi:uncharacterized protein (TIGR02145 family)